MASLFAPVEDGKIVETASQTSLKKANSKNNNGNQQQPAGDRFCPHCRKMVSSKFCPDCGTQTV